MDERAAIPYLGEAVLVVLRRRRLILSIYLSLLATAVAGIFLTPPRYRAAAKILLTSNRAQISTSSEKPTELIRGTDIGQAELNSQLEMLRSRDLIEKVLREMTGEERKGKAGGRFGAAVRRVVGAPVAALRWAYRRVHGLREMEATPLYWRVQAIRQAMGAAPVKNSNVIEIALVGPDPVWAQEFTNRLTNAYVERHARMQRESEAERFFVSQSELLRQKLDDSETELRRLREEAGALAGQQAEVHARLNEFSAELERTKIARAEQQERVAFLERAHAAERREGRVSTPELLALEAKRAELIGNYRPESVRVREIDEQIRTLRTAIASYGTVASGTDAAAPAVAADLTGARAQLEALRGKEEGLMRARDEYRPQAVMLDKQSFDLARLERQVKLNEEAYLSYVRTAEQSRLSNALEQSEMLRLTVVEPAAVPLEPMSPRKGRIFLFALVGGLAVSVGVGFARDYFDGTVKTAADVRRYANLEVLAMVPDRVP